MDRSYWRLESTTRLIEEARTKGCELCVAIGERLEAVEFTNDGKLDEALERARDMEIEANQADDKIYELRVEIDKLELMLGQRDERIAELEAQLKKDKK